jgi:hypothetical protein
MSKLSGRLPDNNNKKLAQLVREFVQGLLARITWYHNIMASGKDNPEREFYIAYHNLTKVQRTVAQIPWGSNLALLEKLEDLNAGAAVLTATIKKNFEEVGV